MNLAELTAHYTAKVSELETLLNEPVLDGTPYLVVGVRNVQTPDFKFSFTVVLKVEGFQGLDVQDNHFCGCLCFDEAGAYSQVDRLSRSGEFPDIRNLGILHRREVLARRLLDARACLAQLETSKA